MNIISIIPARMGSSRFPGKPLAGINGIPMIGHVYYRTRMCTDLSETYVATCDAEIYDYITSIGGKAVMTADTHERCTDRTAEAMLKIEQETGQKIDIVVMVQGDEPMVQPQMISDSVKPMIEDSSVNLVNLMSRLKTRKEHDDPNEVKVVVDRDNYALYFSREPIPSWKKGATDVPMYKQVCIIPFKRDFLITFNELIPTPLEIVESVDMLRVLEHGYRLKMAHSNFESYSVDTKQDLEVVQKLMLNDPMVAEYKSKQV